MAGTMGVWGLASAATGKTFGVSGETRSSTGQASGVQGIATKPDGATYGVLGITKSGAWEAAGVMGKSQGTQGHGVGVRGEVGKGLAGVMGFAKTSGVGVWGTTGSTVAGSAGVFGIGMATDSRNIGVHGVTQSSTGDGVLGEATYPTGENVGVHGLSASREGVAVLGEATTTSPTGSPIGVKGVAPFGIGTVGEGRTGVVGLTEEPNGVGVWANASDPGGATTALLAQVASPLGTAIVAEAPPGIGCTALRVKGESRFEGDVTASHVKCTTFTANSLIDCGSANFTGNITVSGYASLNGGHPGYTGDVAEHLRAGEVEAGDVVVIGPDGKLAKCSQECDTAVAGIVSTKPTLQVGSLQAAGGTAPLALVGVVPCKVDASKYPIKPGDLLASSATPGHAMKCVSKRPAAGTVIGKALEALESGKGTIQVLVTLR
jgi:hypothetical protein